MTTKETSGPVSPADRDLFSEYRGKLLYDGPGVFTGCCNECCRTIVLQANNHLQAFKLLENESWVWRGKKLYCQECNLAKRGWYQTKCECGAELNGYAKGFEHFVNIARKKYWQALTKEGRGTCPVCSRKKA